MPLISLFEASSLINETMVPNIPVVGALAGIVNTLYLMAGGFVGLSIIFFFIRWWDLHKTRKRLEQVESLLELVNKKLDKLLSRARAKKR